MLVFSGGFKSSGQSIVKNKISSVIPQDEEDDYFYRIPNKLKSSLSEKPKHPPLESSKIDSKKVLPTSDEQSATLSSQRDSKISEKKVDSIANLVTGGGISTKSVIVDELQPIMVPSPQYDSANSRFSNANSNQPSSSSMSNSYNAGRRGSRNATRKVGMDRNSLSASSNKRADNKHETKSSDVSSPKEISDYAINYRQRRRTNRNTTTPQNRTSGPGQAGGSEDIDSTNTFADISDVQMYTRDDSLPPIDVLALIDDDDSFSSAVKVGPGSRGAKEGILRGGDDDSRSIISTKRKASYPMIS